jgi:hypothetical protein
MSLEAGVVLDLYGVPIHWHLPLDRTVGSLPDSSDLWQVFWEHRSDLSGFAHSHPSGMAAPSHTDLTTFSGVELGLGQRLDWWIATPTHLVLCRWVGRSDLGYKTVLVTQRPLWFIKLLEHSNYQM